MHLGRVLVSERHRTGVNRELGGVEDDESGIGDDIEIDGDGAAEFASSEVRFEAYVVLFRDGEYRKARLALELLHILIFASRESRIFLRSFKTQIQS